MLALDLIINHHEKYLESQEEARQEAVARLEGQGQPGDPRQPRDQQQQQQSKDQVVCEDHLYEDQPEADRWAVSYPGDSKHSSSVKGATGRCKSHTQDQEHHRPSGTKRTTTTDAIKPRRKRSPAQSTSTVDSVSSASSVYHTLNSDEETTSSLGEQTSDWEDHTWLADHTLEGSRETMINTQSLQHTVPEEEQGNSTGSPHHQGSSRCSAERQQGSGTTLGSLCCESEGVHSASITQCVHALLLLCRSSATICRRLHALGLLSRLLDGFSGLICANDHSYEGKYSC